MSTEIVVITVAAGNTTPIPVSLGGASQVLIGNDGPANGVIQLTADPTDIDFFQVPVLGGGQPPLSIVGTDDEYWYVRGLPAGAGFTMRLMIMSRRP